MKPIVTVAAMGFYLLCFLFLAPVSAFFGQNVEDATIVVDGTKAVANTDPDYICATIDWWPRDKCNYNQCPWGNASVINLNLNHPYLAKAIQAFKPLRIRIGGSLQDQVLYDVGNLKTPCQPFRRIKNGLFGFSRGCLRMDRWDEVNRFLSKTGARVTFGLNALHGRHRTKGELWEGIWDSNNARDLMNYTVSKGYPIDSWEFGNELSGTGIGAHVHAGPYAKDLINLKAIINEFYKDSPTKPLLVAPGGFYEKPWFDELLEVSGSGVVDVMTHHLYNIGAGVDPHLVQKILNPEHLSEVKKIFGNLSESIQMKGPWSSAWVGESGGAYNSGGRHVSDTFVNSFWYLDQLGMAAKYNTKVYCRQSLIGGNYGLLNKTTFVPNPDYYSALLWHQLMGKEVLAVNAKASPYLRTYAHCSKGKAGVTLLLINISNQTDFRVSVENSMGIKSDMKAGTNHTDTSFSGTVKRKVSWVGSVATDGPIFREEYHLTPEKGEIRSKTMLLNGTPLQLTGGGDIPSLKPALVDINTTISIPPLSIKFIALSHFEAKGCTR